MAVRCVLFDVTGVLIDSDLFSVQYAKSSDVEHSTIKAFFEGPYLECITGKRDLKEELAKWLSAWKWSGSVDSFLNYWFTSEQHINMDVMNTVAALKKQGILCCIATNQEKYRQEYINKTLGFEKMFMHIFCSCDIGYKKPQQEFYQYVIKQLDQKYGIRTNEILFFDDTEDNVAAAIHEGIQARVYTGYESLKQSLDEYGLCR